MGAAPGAGGSVHLDADTDDRAGPAQDRAAADRKWAEPHGASQDVSDRGPDRPFDPGPAGTGGRPVPRDGAPGAGGERPRPAGRPLGEPAVEHERPAGRSPGRPSAHPTDAAAHPDVSPGPDGAREATGAVDAATRPGAPTARPHPTWDDGFIARRAPVTGADTPTDASTGTSAADTFAADTPADAPVRPAPSVPAPASLETTPPVGPFPTTGGLAQLRTRLEALRQVVLLTRSRLGGPVLAEADRVLAEAAARGRLSTAYTVVALAGATGSGKSSLLNALAGAPLAEAGTRRPTTSEPLACVWPAEEDGTAAEALLDRLGVAEAHRHRAPGADDTLAGLLLLDLPDHDSLAAGHRARVDRLLQLVDAVVWVVDPEKYADAVLHERYLRPLAGHGEVTFVVLNQVDRLPAGSVDHVLHDLRRLLDEDGMPLGEHGDLGATVLAMSTLTGEGVEELRSSLGALVAGRSAPVRRLAADLDGAVVRLQPAFVAPGVPGPVGLTEQVREEFEDLLALAVGAQAAGQAAERRWLRCAERACGTPWLRWASWCARRLRPGRVARSDRAAAATTTGTAEASEGPAAETATAPRVARPLLAQAVRSLADEAAAGLPSVWTRTVREAAWRGAKGLPEALEEVARPPTHEAAAADAGAGAPTVAGPRWWTVARLAQTLLATVLVLGLAWCGLTLAGRYDLGWLPPLLLSALGAGGGPVVAAACRVAARSPAHAYGQQEEQQLRQRAADCGRDRVVEPVLAELARYRQAREQYAVAAGGQGLL